MVGFLRYGHILFIIILDNESSGHVTHDSHKLHTKVINHSTHHYMNHMIHIPLLGVLSFPPSDGLSALSL